MKSLRNLFKVIQLIYDKAPIQTQAIWFLQLCFQLQHYKAIHKDILAELNAVHKITL